MTGREMELERKFAAGALSMDAGAVISGYASLFENRDSGGDVISAGAYGAALARLSAAGAKVRMLWQHDPAQPIGVWDEIREDATGLWVKGRLLQDVQLGREAVALLQAGAIDGLSIGYRTKRARPEGTGRRLEEIELWEVSLVTFPMQSAARISGKSDEGLTDLVARFRNARATCSLKSAQ